MVADDVAFDVEAFEGIVFAEPRRDALGAWHHELVEIQLQFLEDFRALEQFLKRFAAVRLHVVLGEAEYFEVLRVADDWDSAFRF